MSEGRRGGFEGEGGQPPQEGEQNASPVEVIPETKKTVEYSAAELATEVRNHFERMESAMDIERLRELFKALEERLNPEQKEVVTRVLKKEIAELTEQGHKLITIVQNVIRKVEPILKAVESQDKP